MSKGDRTKRANGVTVDGEWLPLPVDFIRSRACAELSPAGLKMLIDLASQLGANGRGNGRIDAGRDTTAARGWASSATVCAALRELTEAGLIVRTLEPRKGRLALYGLTLWPMHCNPAGLDHGPGAWTSKEWRHGDRAAMAEKPSLGAPATWRKTRSSPAEKRNRCTRSGSATPLCAPAAEVHEPENTPCASAAEAQTEVSTMNALPQRNTPLDTPSASASVKAAQDMRRAYAWAKLLRHGTASARLVRLVPPLPQCLNG